MPPAKAPLLERRARDRVLVKVVECVFNWDLIIWAHVPQPTGNSWTGRCPGKPLQFPDTTNLPVLYEFRVRSDILSLARPVFDRMLNGRFQEGNAKEISLPADHPGSPRNSVRLGPSQAGAPPTNTARLHRSTNRAPCRQVRCIRLAQTNGCTVHQQRSLPLVLLNSSLVHLLDIWPDRSLCCHLRRLRP